MNKQLLNAWAKPIFDFYRELAAIVKDTRFDMDMLDKAEALVKRMPAGNPDPLDDALYEAMYQAMQKTIIKQARKSIKTLAVADDFSPIKAEVEKISSKSPVVSAINNEAWEDMPLQLRDGAFWAARLQNEKLAFSMQRLLQNHIAQKRGMLGGNNEAFVDRTSFILKCRQIALDEGLDTGEGNVMTNIASERRLGLIFDFQTASASNFAQWKLNNDPNSMAIFPASQLSASRARVPRSDAFWASRWQEAGEQVGWEGAHKTKWVALNNSPIWTALSRFGMPWPPFEFGSTRVLEEVWRDDVEKLGLLGPDDETPPAPDRQFTDDLKESVNDLSKEQKDRISAAFGDQVSFDKKTGEAAWQGNVISKLVDDIMKPGLDNFNASLYNGRTINLGAATDQAITKAAAVKKSDGSKFDLTGTTMRMDPTRIHHLLERHGIVGSGLDKNQRPILPKDIEIIPHVWRRPDRIKIGDNNRSLEFEKTIIGRHLIFGFDHNPKQKEWNLSSARILK